MSEYRQDSTTGEWVIVAPGRQRRPLAWNGRSSSAPATGGDPVCPFCAGNERLLPPIIAQTPANDGREWFTRVVSNKYPALQPLGDPEPLPPGPQLRLAGFGYHEVIIETPRHDADLATLSDTELEVFTRTCHGRFTDLASRPGVEAVMVFRNRGHHAGASLTHPHSQVIATAIAAPRIAARSEWGRARFAATGRCPTCDDLAHEATDGRRIVECAGRFLTVVPFAASSPFEMRITPFRHSASFVDASADELAELGPLLRRAVQRLDRALGGPDYNLMIESATSDRQAPGSDHWSVRVVPELVRRGGFERSAGLSINPSRPEDDAAALRAVRIPGS